MCHASKTKLIDEPRAQILSQIRNTSSFLIVPLALSLWIVVIIDNVSLNTPTFFSLSTTG